MRNKTYTSRWNTEDNYKSNWIARSQKLLNLFDKYERQDGQNYHFAEYGCGPNAPFSKLCETRSSDCVTKYDIKKWDQTVNRIDLNAKNVLIPAANVCVFSGVLEYLNNVEDILTKSIEVSSYVLLSYYFTPLASQHIDEICLKTINTRINNGVRNHYTPKEIISIASSVGVISAMDLWDNGGTNHILMLLRNFNNESSD